MNKQTTNIIFVRHAQSVYGEDDRNRPLSEEGLKDREIVLATLKDRKIDAFLCSPYKRSIDTIKPASEYFDLNIDTDELIEREYKLLGEEMILGIQSGYFNAVAHPDRIFRKRRVWDDDLLLFMSKKLR